MDSLRNWLFPFFHEVEFRWLICGGVSAVIPDGRSVVEQLGTPLAIYVRVGGWDAGLIDYCDCGFATFELRSIKKEEEIENRLSDMA